ncbi:hypothetical protein DVB69_03065 [Sporosarcina sp. BI001-red]|uniref:hypothetical protein n=1 Tax=Sporosarcina sp. BI001-red TaxID=2282866 RepID=UPI000E22A08B|nr:hypothetical protein [Sporosarcina sp. BI001-red]REB09803.1 hypothetical protein DVB69_03065 [Sporosarcina sp. BI001-red]
MSEIRWLLIGSDRRIEECADVFKEEGLNVAVHLYDEVTDELTNKISEIHPTHIVLPVQGVQGRLNSKLFSPGTVFFTGIISELQRTELESEGHIVSSYLSDERFVWNNALLTAEGFVKEFYLETNAPIARTHFQIAGFGRVGRMLAHVLAAAGAKLTIFARSEAQLGEAEALGFAVEKLSSDVEFKSGYLINTIPSQWLSLQSEDSLRVFDLASKPGCLKPGMSSAYYTLHLGLPGKHFPQRAASYLADTILRMCRGKE